MKPSVSCASVFPGMFISILQDWRLQNKYGTNGNSIWKTRWLESLPTQKLINVSPALQFRDSEWFFHKVQAHCFTLEAMQSGEGRWSAHPRHTLQTWGWLFSFCFYIPCWEAHNPWMQDAYTQCLHWVPNKWTWQACPDGDHQIFPRSSPLGLGAQRSKG